MAKESVEFEALKKVTASILGMDPQEIRLDMTFMSDLGADSLDLYQIVMGVEDELNISVPEDALKKVKTVRDAVELVESVNK